MADITDPVLARWVRELHRPHMEDATQFAANADYQHGHYTDDILPTLLTLDNADVILEGRNDVPPLTVGEIKLAMAKAKVMADSVDAAARTQMSKARVRPLRAQ